MPPGIGYINPQIILRALQQRGIMPPQNPRGGIDMIAPQDVTSMLPQRGRPQQPGQVQIQEKPGGLSGFLKTPGLQQGLMATGQALLAQKDRAGSFGGALGRALPSGMQAFQQGKQDAALDEFFADAPPEMQNLMRGLSPQMREGIAGNLLMQRLQPQAPPEREVHELPDGRLVSYNPATDEYGTPYGEPEQESPTATQKEFEDYRENNPDMSYNEAWESFWQSRRGPGVTVNNNPQSAVQDAVVGINSAAVERSVEQADAAREQLGKLRSIERLLDEGVQTGAVEERTLPLRQLAASFGVGDADRLIAQENFQALTNEIAIGMTQQLSGQISERELDFVRAAVPNIGTTPEANRRIVEVAKLANQTAIDVAEAKMEYFSENGTLSGFEPIRRRIVQDNLLDQLPEADAPPPPANPDARFNQLLQEGLSADEIIEIGKREGWIKS